MMDADLHTEKNAAAYVRESISSGRRWLRKNVPVPERIKTVETLTGLRLRVRFDDGRVVLYDVAGDVRDIPSYSPLESITGLFEQVQLDTSRTCVFWNDEIDLPSDAIYEHDRELAPASQSRLPRTTEA